MTFRKKPWFPGTGNDTWIICYSYIDSISFRLERLMESDNDSRCICRIACVAGASDTLHQRWSVAHMLLWRRVFFALESPASGSLGRVDCVYIRSWYLSELSVRWETFCRAELNGWIVSSPHQEHLHGRRWKVHLQTRRWNCNRVWADCVGWIDRIL